MSSPCHRAALSDYKLVDFFRHGAFVCRDAHPFLTRPTGKLWQATKAHLNRAYPPPPYQKYFAILTASGRIVPQETNKSNISTFCPWRRRCILQSGFSIMTL